MPETIPILPTDVAGWVSLIVATAAALGIFWRGGRLEQSIRDSISGLESRVTEGEQERGALQRRMHQDDVDRTSMHNEIGYLKGGLEQVIKRMEAREERAVQREERRIELDRRIAEQLSAIEVRLNVVGSIDNGIDRVVDQMRKNAERRP